MFIWMKTEKTKKDKPFHFKQFSLHDSRCAMKIGTDAVLLGSYAAGFESDKILDVGTGSGIIALMIAQKTGKIIHAIDIDAAAVKQAAENFSKSPWAHYMQAFHCSLQEFVPEESIKYDLIVSNPPYFQNSLKSKNIQRTTARHDQNLKLGDFFYFSEKLLDKKGIIVTITPYNLRIENEYSANKSMLYLNKQLIIKPNLKLQPVRIIQVFSRIPAQDFNSETLCIEKNKRNDFSDEYRNLTRDYHPFL